MKVKISMEAGVEDLENFRPGESEEFAISNVRSLMANLANDATIKLADINIAMTQEKDPNKKEVLKKSIQHLRQDVELIERLLENMKVKIQS